MHNPPLPPGNDNLAIQTPTPPIPSGVFFCLYGISNWCLSYRSLPHPKPPLCKGRWPAGPEGWCSRMLRICRKPMQIRYFVLRQSFSQLAMTVACGQPGRGSASPQDWHSLPRLASLTLYTREPWALPRHSNETTNRNLKDAPSYRAEMLDAVQCVSHELLPRTARQTVI